MKRIGKLSAIAVVSLCLFVLVSFAASAVELTDIEGHWAKEYIEYGVEKGYISGYADGTFLPDKTVTRAEFSKMINNAVGLTAVGTAKADFEDVRTSEWYFNEVKKAENAGYITGYEDGTFRPSNSVTRQEAAVILSRIVLPISERADVNAFGDGKNIDTWATDAVTMIAAKGYIKGDENGNFIPKGSLTRSQAAKLICEVVKNENIVNRNQNITDADKALVYSETIFTDDIVIAVEDANELEVEFKNCRVLGNVYVKTEGAAVELENTKVKNLYVDKDDAEIALDKTSEVKTAYVSFPSELSGNGFVKVVLLGDELSTGLVLNGTFAEVEVQGDATVTADVIKKVNVTGKVSLNFLSGTVESLETASSAKGATISLSKKTVVEKVNNKAAVSYVGSGTIEVANNEVTGVEFDGVTVDSVTGKKGDGDSVGSKTDDQFFKNVEVTPEKGKTGQAISVNVVFTFLDQVFDKSGEKLIASYVEDYFELRRASATGTTVEFDASIASTNKKITLNPSENLKSGTKYYVVIPAGTITYDDGSENDEFVTYFTTVTAAAEEPNDDSDDVDITFSPANGKTVSVDSDISISFSDKVYRTASKGSLTATYCEDTAFEIRKGSKTGSEVDFTADVASTAKKVTLTPDEMLEPGEKYYVIVNKKLYDASGSLIPSEYIYFNTDDGLAVTITPENDAKNVSTTPEIVLEFSETVLNYNGKALTASDVEEAVEIREKTKTGSNVFYTANVETGGKRVTITPDEALTAGTKYYIIIAKESFEGKESEEYNEEIVSYFTVASATAPMITPADGKRNVSIGTTIEVTFSDKLYAYSAVSTKGIAKKDELTSANIADYVEAKDVVILRRDSSSSEGREIKCDVDISSDGKTIILTPRSELAVNKEYFVIVKSSTLYVGSGTKYNGSATTNFSTNETLVPTFVPEDGEKDVEVDDNLTITFTENIYNTDGDSITERYLKSVVSLYERDTEEPVLFSATLKGKVITVNPSENLDGGKYYVLKVNAETITNNSGKLNQMSSTTFRTEAKVNTSITFTPKASATNVSVYVKPEIEFASPIYTAELDDLTETYVNDYIGLYKSSTIKEENRVNAVVTFSDDFKTFTIDPVEPLEKNKTYYIYVAKEFKYENGNMISAAQKKSFKTTNDDETAPLECPVCGGSHEEADCPENEPDVPVVGCPFCHQAHAEADHVCSKCGETGHENARWCEICGIHTHNTDDAHCEGCGLYGHEYGEDCPRYEAPDNGGETPDNGGETPDNGGETPGNGGETPDNGGQTP